VLSLDAAYEAVIAGDEVVVAHPPARRLIRLSGPQRVWFLQNTITADIESAEPGTWVESCLLDERGRVFAHFLAGIAADEIFIADVPAYGARLADWFVSRRFRTKIDVEQLETSRFTRIGAEASPETFETGPVRFHRSFGDISAIDVFDDGLVADAPDELYDLLRIEAGYGRYGVDFDERTLPQEAGLSRTLSTDKGCYVGQETVARIHFRGHINKVLRTLRFDDDVPVGTDLLLGTDVVGRVTSSVRSPRLGPVGLAIVRVEPEEGADLVAGGVRAVLGPIPEGTKVKTG
jgi:tRNA-modifying protein YgfZ